MKNYLKTTIEKMKGNNYAELNLVIGNESCDLDSAVAALVYATFLDWRYDKIKCCKVCTRFNRDETTYKDDIYVPILNVHREDYPLKTEVSHCLAEAGITEENLVFREDYNLRDLINNAKTKVILVDHHALSTHDQFLAPYVTEIIDHRPLDKSQWTYAEDTRSTIDIVGSCCTLITQRIRDLSALVATELDFFKDFRICADMLHSTIILDTVNFSKAVDKATRHDVEMVTFLENILKPENVESERKSKLDRLVSARSDVSSLDASQLLRKDVKMFGDILVPSFPILVKVSVIEPLVTLYQLQLLLYQEFFTRPGVLESVRAALEARECSLALLLGMDLTGGLRRDVAIWSPDIDRTLQLCELLQSWQPSLDLLADQLANNFEDVKYYKQENLRATRKQYIPAVMKYLNKY